MKKEPLAFQPHTLQKYSDRHLKQHGQNRDLHINLCPDVIKENCAIHKNQFWNTSFAGTISRTEGVYLERDSQGFHKKISGFWKYPWFFWLNKHRIPLLKWCNGISICLVHPNPENIIYLHRKFMVAYSCTCHSCTNSGTRQQ